MNELTQIQTELHAPKNQTNKFGGYKYRSCEDIVEALKPLLAKHDCQLIIEDDLVVKGDHDKQRFYVKATARLAKDGNTIAQASAFAREEESKKGMDSAQLTGATSSYARKYALNGLFCIDDTKDADATNTHEKTSKPTSKPSMTVQEAISKIEAATTLDELKNVFTGLPAALKNDDKVIAAKDDAKYDFANNE